MLHPIAARLAPLVLTGLLALVAGSTKAHACASCGCGDPTLTAMGQEKPFKNRIRLAIEERVGAHSTGTPGADAERDLLSRTTLSGSWSPTAWLSLGLSLPLVALRSEAGRLVRQIVGLGDGELLVRALAFRDRRFSPRHTIGLLAGLKAPTGPRVSDGTGYPAPDDLQPGSGSWDATFGTGYSYFGDVASVFLSLAYRLTTPGWHGFRRGSTLGGSLAVQLSAGRRAAIVLGLDGTWAAASEIGAGVAVPDTGGFLLTASPGILVALPRDLLLRLVVQVPLIERWRGQQHESATGILSFVVDL